MPTINGIVRPCYLCSEFTSKPALKSGIVLCSECTRREFPIVIVTVDAPKADKNLEAFRRVLDNLGYRSASPPRIYKHRVEWPCGCVVILDDNHQLYGMNGCPIHPGGPADSWSMESAKITAAGVVE